MGGENGKERTWFVLESHKLLYGCCGLYKTNPGRNFVPGPWGKHGLLWEGRELLPGVPEISGCGALSWVDNFGMNRYNSFDDPPPPPSFFFET
jgi:hypothetical protein